jgi:hypothetical protein
MGGYISSLADLTTLGRSILASTILPPLTTRKWLKPVTHTSSLVLSIGSPWEIMRESVPVVTTPSKSKRTSPNSNSQTTTKRTEHAKKTRTRIVDLYTKQGGGYTYTSLLGLSPDHDLGVSILTAGPDSFTTFAAIRQLFVDIYLPAAEQAARAQAEEQFVGVYTTLSGATEGNNGARAEIALLPDEPALCLTRLVSNGTDVLEEFLGVASSGGQVGETRMWLYPMGLVAPAPGGGKRTAFRGLIGLVGREVAEDCGSWSEGDRSRWGNYPGDLLVFETGPDGRATAVEAPALGLTLPRGGV